MKTLKENAIENGFLAIEYGLLKMNELTQNEKLILAYVKSFTRENKDLSASNKFIAEELGMSETTVTASIKKLLNLEYIANLYEQDDLRNNLTKRHIIILPLAVKRIAENEFKRKSEREKRSNEIEIRKQKMYENKKAILEIQNTYTENLGNTTKIESSVSKIETNKNSYNINDKNNEIIKENKNRNIRIENIEFDYSTSDLIENDLKNSFAKSENTIKQENLQLIENNSVERSEITSNHISMPMAISSIDIIKSNIENTISTTEGSSLNKVNKNTIPIPAGVISILNKFESTKKIAVGNTHEVQQVDNSKIELYSTEISLQNSFAESVNNKLEDNLRTIENNSAERSETLKNTISMPSAVSSSDDTYCKIISNVQETPHFRSTPLNLVPTQNRSTKYLEQYRYKGKKIENETIKQKKYESDENYHQRTTQLHELFEQIESGNITFNLVKQFQYLSSTKECYLNHKVLTELYEDALANDAHNLNNLTDDEQSNIQLIKRVLKDEEERKLKVA